MTKRTKQTNKTKQRIEAQYKYLTDLGYTLGFDIEGEVKRKALDSPCELLIGDKEYTLDHCGVDTYDCSLYLIKEDQTELKLETYHQSEVVAVAILKEQMVIPERPFIAFLVDAAGAKREAVFTEVVDSSRNVPNVYILKGHLLDFK